MRVSSFGGRMRISRGCRGALDDNDTVVGEGRQVMKFGMMGIPRIMISMRCKRKFAEPKYQSKRFSLGLFVRDESRCSNIFYDSLQAESLCIRGFRRRFATEKLRRPFWRCSLDCAGDHPHHLVAKRSALRRCRRPVNDRGSLCACCL